MAAMDTAGGPAPGGAAARSDDDARLLEAVGRGDEAAFRTLIERYNATLLRLARMYVSNLQAAEDAVQETWIGVLRGASRFEGRSSVKTWITRILVNQARTAAQREGRSISFADLGDDSDPFHAVDPERFGDAGHWSIPPREWERPEERLLAGETREVVERAIAALPVNQRLTITMRDVDGLSSAETCAALGVSEGNQRVLLHRARSRVRAALDEYLGGGHSG